MAFIEATLLSPFQKVQTACKMERGGFGSMKQNKYDDPTFFAEDSTFTITKLSEPQTTREMLDKHPDMRDETRRPMFLLIAAVKTGQ